MRLVRRLRAFLGGSQLRSHFLIAGLLVAMGATTGARVVPDPGAGTYAAVGSRPERGYFAPTPVGRVDMVNGNLSMSFTDLVLPGNAGMDLRITRTYNHQRGADHNPWSFGFAGAPIYIRTNDNLLVMGDGSEHKMHSGVVTGYLVTTDFWKYHTSTKTLYFPNGWVATYETYMTDMLKLSDVHDQFGNSLTPTFNSGGHVTQVVQTVSDSTSVARTRTVTFTYNESVNVELPTEISDGTRTWTYDYDYSGPGNFKYLTAAIPPTGPSWEYEYGLSGLGGSLTVTVPTGGTVAYTFHSQEMGSAGDKSVVESITTGGRAVNGGTWDVTIDEPSGEVLTSDVETPNGNTVAFVHQYRDGPDGVEWTLESRSITDGTDTATVEREYTSVSFGSLPAIKVVNTQTITQDGVSFVTEYAYHSGDFADYLRPYQITESASNTGATRVTTLTFDNGFTFGALMSKVASKTITLNSQSATAEYSYNHSTGFMTAEGALGKTTYFAPDANGNVGTVTDIHSHQNVTGYQWGAVVYVETPEYQIFRTANSDGTVSSETRNGATTYFSYDALGRVTTVTPPEGTATTTSFASDGSAVTVTRGASVVTTTLDGFGRPIATTNAEGVTATTTYDPEGRQLTRSAPYVGSSSGGNSFIYDVLGRVRTITHTDSSTVIYGYSGTDVSITDENDHTTIQHWEVIGSPGNGRLVGVTDADGQDWAYSYNKFGSLILVEPPSGPNRSWTYDGTTNLLTSETQPESGTTTYTYDYFGLLSTRTDAEDQETTYHYDGNHRLTEITAPSSAETITFEYDDANNRKRMLVGSVDTHFTFDDANRLERREDVIDGRTFTTLYDYDGRDNLTTMTYPSGRTVQYNYDDANRITKVYSGSTTYADGLTYHATGALTAMTFGNTKTESLTLNSRYRANHLVSGPLDVTYGYDYAGNVTSIDDDRSGKSSTFEYDELDRLKIVTGYGANTFTYDEQGNRRTKGSGSSLVEYNYSSTTNRLTSATSALGAPEIGTFEYWDNGNLKSDDDGEYTYTSRNQMASVTMGSAVTHYDYDAAGIRTVKRTTSRATYFIHGPGGQLLAEYEATPGAPALAREYIYLGSRLLASFASPTPSTQKAQLLSPAINSPAAGSSVTFQWTAGIGVAQYWVYVGNTVGAYDLGGCNGGTNLSCTITGLPIDGRTMYIRMHSHISGSWVYSDYVIKAVTAQKAVLTSPAPNSTLSSSSATFQWTAGVEVAYYWVYVGNTVGAYDVGGCNAGTSLSCTISSLPTDGRTLYIRMFSHIGGSWVYNDYILTAAGLAEGDETDPDAPSPGFTAAPRVDYTWIANLLGTGNGTVSSSPSGFNCSGSGASCTATFAASTTLTLTATPSSGHTFGGWGGACSGMSTTCELDVTEALTVTATFNGTPTITYYHADLLGSVRAITDGSGATVIRHDFMAFGESNSELVGDLRRYIGGEMDAESAFEYLGARYYKNLWGRFTSVDPIVSAGAATNPQLWNRYAYGLNGPLRFSDPTGLTAVDLEDFSGDRIDPNSIAFQSSFNELMKAVPGLTQKDASDLMDAINNVIAQMMESINVALPGGFQLTLPGGYRETSIVVARGESGRLVIIPQIPGPFRMPTNKKGDFYEHSFKADPSYQLPEKITAILLDIHVHPRNYGVPPYSRGPSGSADRISASSRSYPSAVIGPNRGDNGFTIYTGLDSRADIRIDLQRLLAGR